MSSLSECQPCRSLLHEYGRNSLQRADQALVQGLRVFTDLKCWQTRKESGHLPQRQNTRQNVRKYHKGAVEKYENSQKGIRQAMW